tara:strand:- start:3184 stop:3909 length:726 start_codon:yes stop_codon:yes gene_type:complete
MLGLGSSISKGGSSETTPSDISGLQIWYKNDTGVVAAQWDDSSGNGRHAVQATTNEQASVSGGGLSFDSANPEDFYDVTESGGYVDLGAANPFTLSVVFKRDDAADNNTIFAGVAQNQYIAFLNEEYLTMRTTGTNEATASAVFPTDTWVEDVQMLVTITKDTSGNLLYFKNGVAITPDSGTLVNAGEIFVAKYFGSQHDGSVEADKHWDGIIYEVALYNTQLTGNNLTDLNQYLTSKFEL